MSADDDVVGVFASVIRRLVDLSAFRCFHSRRHRDLNAYLAQGRYFGPTAAILRYLIWTFRLQKPFDLTNVTIIVSFNAATTMSPCFSGQSERAHFYNPLSQISSNVNTSGQVAVRFHRNPKRLEHWFSNKQRNSVNKKAAASVQYKILLDHPDTKHVDNGGDVAIRDLT